jgi:HK97 gp10 family phage protein
MKITVSGLDRIADDLNKELSRLVQRVAAETDSSARANTPIKTGHARRSWRKQVDDKGFTVENKVPYIERLEAGASRQAPRGIIGPTLTQVKGKFK